MANNHCFGASNQTRHKLIVHSAVNNQARGSRAFLAGATKCAVQSAGHCSVHITVIHDDQCIFGAHLQLNTCEIGCPRHSNAAPDRNRPRKADGVNRRAVNKVVANLAASAHDKVEYAGWYAVLGNDLCERNGRSWHQVGGLPHHCVAKC